MLLDLSKFSLSVVEFGYQHPSIAAVILLSILLAVGYGSSWTKKKPRLIPGVPFVGVENGKVGKADVARRFVSNSSDLLEEGYKMVRSIITTSLKHLRLIVWQNFRLVEVSSTWQRQIPVD